MSQSVMQKKTVCYLQGQGHSEGSYGQNMNLSLIIHHFKPEGLVEKKKEGITAFKVKITSKVQNFIQSLRILSSVSLISWQPN